MLRVGLTGGLACGKSFVARLLGEHGCHVIRADEVGHEVLQPGGEAYGPVLAEFGDGILAADGRTIDRRKLGDQVFGNPERLAVLNGLVHPAVFKIQDEFAQAAAARDPSAIVVVEAAILIETGSYLRYDKLIMVICSPEQQVERAMHREGARREEVASRIQRQMPMEEKRKYADFVIDTSGTKEHTMVQTRMVYKELRRLSQ